MSAAYTREIAARPIARSRWRERPWVAVAVFVVGVAVLARAQRYFGSLLSGWDAQHYYAAARSIVLDRDLDITNDLEATPFTRPFDRDADGYLEAPNRDANGRIISRYPIGLPLIEAPWLALGHGTRRVLAAMGLSSSRPVGYADVEIWTVALGLLAVFAIGMQLLHALLCPHVPAPWREVALVAAWWGTSLLYYSSVFPFMAHATGFALVVWTVWIAASIGAGTKSPRSLPLLGFALGALYCVRQQQVVLAAPLLLLLAPLRAQPPRRWVGWALVGIAVFVLCAALQAWAHEQLGSGWASDFSRNSWFDWLHPDFWTVLISPARGLLWISPIVVLAIVGFLVTPPRTVPRPFAVFALSGLIGIYVIGCWHAADQSDSFGIRMWCESAGAVACGVGLLYRQRSATTKLLISVAIGACLLWTNRLLYLYMNGHLHIGMSHAECLRQVFGCSGK